MRQLSLPHIRKLIRRKDCKLKAGPPCRNFKPSIFSLALDPYLGAIGSLRTISCKVCAVTVTAPGCSTWADTLSTASMSRSVALTRTRRQRRP